ncbi:hypothetical protein K431DRAFT_140805 [Polychaeton citri CBS 116435]|uniref:Uncharacterized protein n=1 Tax=Polychaeton citri CBS 116435 TaxID=1314669 RepID=A0A9P4Q2A9_9PEZI|nr:hypothetical protein K431DRAFT_140805 [Polychaeton citri CBS 116435]
MPLTMYDMSHHRIPRALDDPPTNPSPSAPSMSYQAYGSAFGGNAWNLYAPRNSISDASSTYSADSHRHSTASSIGAFDNADDDSFLARTSSFQRIADVVHGEISVVDEEDESMLGGAEDAPTPSCYAKVMRAFTLNQMKHQQLEHVTPAADCKSANCSPTMAPDLASTISGTGNAGALPLHNDIQHLSLAEGPAAPCNSPACISSTRAEYIGADEIGHVGRFRARAMRKRSITEPIPRDFTANKVKHTMLV